MDSPSSISVSFAPTAIENRLGPEGLLDLNRIVSGHPLVDNGSLLQQLSLHLPRFSLAENNDRKLVISEAARLAERLSHLRQPYQNFIPRPDTESSLRQLHFGSVADEIAEPILSRFHYILSFRIGSTHFGVKLRNEDHWPVVLATISSFDLNNTAPALEMCGIQPVNTVVLSRVFAFPAAPQNSVSFLLSRIRNLLAKENPDLSAMLTYVNPNVGFSATSYKADNWTLLGDEGSTRYLYFKENYITDRKALRLFGESFDKLIQPASAQGLTWSQCELLPLLLYIRGISNKLQIRPRHFDRWRVGGSGV